MTNESLKLDMTQPLNRYALIVDYFERNPDKLTINNRDYLCGTLEIAHCLWNSFNGMNLSEQFSEIEDSLYIGRLPSPDLISWLFSRMKVPTLEEVLPALPLLR